MPYWSRSTAPLRSSSSWLLPSRWATLVIPLAFASRRLYVTRPFPWNWVAFFPVQIVFGGICAVGSILFLQLTKIDREPFPVLLRQNRLFRYRRRGGRQRARVWYRRIPAKAERTQSTAGADCRERDHRAAAARRRTQAGARDPANAAAQHIAAARRSSDRRSLAAST